LERWWCTDREEKREELLGWGDEADPLLFRSESLSHMDSWDVILDRRLETLLEMKVTLCRICRGGLGSFGFPLVMGTGFERSFFFANTLSLRSGWAVDPRSCRSSC
jgi:hypothetical protein